MLAVVNGEAIAAMSMTDRRVIANPFIRTQHAVTLLRMRAHFGPSESVGAASPAGSAFRLARPSGQRSCGARCRVTASPRLSSA